MKTNGRYTYLSGGGEGYKEVYSPDNPPVMYEHQLYWSWMEGNAQCSCTIRLLSDRPTKYNNLGEVVDDLCRIVVAPNNYSSIYFDLINGSFRNSTNTEFVTMTSIQVDRDGITTNPIKITAYPLTHKMTFARDKSVRDFVLKRM